MDFDLRLLGLQNEIVPDEHMGEVYTLQLTAEKQKHGYGVVWLWDGSIVFMNGPSVIYFISIPHSPDPTMIDLNIDLDWFFVIQENIETKSNTQIGGCDTLERANDLALEFMDANRSMLKRANAEEFEKLEYSRVFVRQDSSQSVVKDYRYTNL